MRSNVLLSRPASSSLPHEQYLHCKCCRFANTISCSSRARTHRETSAKIAWATEACKLRAAPTPVMPVKLQLEASRKPFAVGTADSHVRDSLLCSRLIKQRHKSVHKFHPSGLDYGRCRLGRSLALCIQSVASQTSHFERAKLKTGQLAIAW